MTAIMPFIVNNFGTNRKPISVPINDCLIPTYILSLTVSKFQVIADYWSKIGALIGCRPTSLQYTRSRLTPKLMTMKFGLKKLETSFCRVLQNVYRYFEPRRQGLRV